mmetsp:Transcript_53154/g.105693  ORF Transcript_53154/g.105693 Transcript_53154/m.105693 type:complete len:243 (-) Transcript_53154:655-1383(-)
MHRLCSPFWAAATCDRTSQWLRRLCRPIWCLRSHSWHRLLQRPCRQPLALSPIYHLGRGSCPFTPPSWTGLCASMRTACCMRTHSTRGRRQAGSGCCASPPICRLHLCHPFHREAVPECCCRTRQPRRLLQGGDSKRSAPLLTTARSKAHSPTHPSMMATEVCSLTAAEPRRVQRMSHRPSRPRRRRSRSSGAVPSSRAAGSLSSPSSTARSCASTARKLSRVRHGFLRQMYPHLRPSSLPA